MREKLIAKLLFEYFFSQKLVTHVTGWDITDPDKDDPLPEIKFLDWFTEKDDKPVGFIAEHETNSVEHIYYALKEISTNSLRAKLSSLQRGDEGTNGLIVLNPADYVFWARKSRWFPDEAIALSVGFCPTQDTISFLSKIEEKHSKTSRILSEFLERQHLYFDAINSGNLEGDGDVLEYVAWLERLEFSVPNGLIETVRRFHGAPEDRAKAQINARAHYLDPREKTSLLQMILVMAMDCYKFDPKSKRVDMAKEIEERAASNGMTISRETIRKHLKSAGELLKGDWNAD